MSRLTITLSTWPPSTNALYRNAPRVGRVKTRDYKTWLNAAGWQLKEQRVGHVSGPYFLHLALARPKDKRRRDIDNRIKAASDLLVSLGITDDDAKAEDCRVFYDDTLAEGCVITVGSVEAEAA